MFSSFVMVAVHGSVLFMQECLRFAGLESLWNGGDDVPSSTPHYLASLSAPQLVTPAFREALDPAQPAAITLPSDKPAKPKMVVPDPPFSDGIWAYKKSG